MAADQVALMQALGFPRFRVAGHDRGGRVAHRMALDHPQAVERIAVLDIVPTATMYARTDRAFATGYYHWFFLIQPAPLPERLIGADPEFYLAASSRPGARGRTASSLRRRSREYVRCFSDPAAIARDLRGLPRGGDDRPGARRRGRGAADRGPLLVLWGERGLVGRTYDVLATWREKARDVRGHALPTGHYLPEEAPAAVSEALADFFRA